MPALHRRSPGRRPAGPVQISVQRASATPRLHGGRTAAAGPGLLGVVARAGTRRRFRPHCHGSPRLHRALGSRTHRGAARNRHPLRPGQLHRNPTRLVRIRLPESDLALSADRPAPRRFARAPAAWRRICALHRAWPASPLGRASHRRPAAARLHSRPAQPCRRRERARRPERRDHRRMPRRRVASDRSPSCRRRVSAWRAGDQAAIRTAPSGLPPCRTTLASPRLRWRVRRHAHHRIGHSVRTRPVVGVPDQRAAYDCCAPRGALGRPPVSAHLRQRLHGRARARGGAGARIRHPGRGYLALRRAGLASMASP